MILKIKNFTHKIRKGNLTVAGDLIIKEKKSILNENYIKEKYIK